MPTRLLRDWTDSFKVAKLSAEAERLFIRIIMKADDFGRFHADARLLTANCLPLVGQLTVIQVESWLSEIQAADLISVYCDKSGRKLLEIKNFKQRTRAQVSKFPENDGQMTVKCPSNASPPRSETEAYSEAKPKAEADTGKRASGVPATQEQAVEWAGMRGVPSEQAKQYFDQLEGRNWKDGSGQPVTNFQSYAASRYSRTKNEPNSKHTGNRTQTPSERRNSQMYD